ncbi:leucine-rich repeat-containing protein 15-like [Penaeus indicus]|uniref:leucine-rich repeat-containing protein 15-like n=1 Tax=Penaeus indicus TaxID=29960 RepID=UPI00300D21F2
MNLKVSGPQLISKELLLLALLLWCAAREGASCPASCRCSLDGRGRRAVACEAGGMADPIPVTAMAADTEVLMISSPPARPNALTLGPIFKGLRRLEEIHVTASAVPALGEHSLWGLQRLRVLNLTRNHIAALMDTNFRGADDLRALDLSRNRIASVPSAVFRHVRRLKGLTLAHNMMPELVPRIFFGLTRLEHLDLSYNPLQDLQPEQFSDVPELRQLACAGCGLTSLSSSLLQALSRLQVLDLRHNRLTQVPPGIATTFLPELMTLLLDANLVSFVERGVIGGSALQTLQLAHNRISRVEVGAFANSSLKNLDLSYNRLTHLDTRAISEVLLHLHELHLSGNSLHIEQLLVVLPEADQLRRLSLGDMGLTRLPAELLQHLRYLHHLNFSSNYLTKFPTGILRSAPQLQTLDLSSNSLQEIDDDAVAAINQVKALRKLRLEGNPWQCDQCHVGPLLRWLQGAPDQESGCSEPRVWTCLRCAGPVDVAGLELALLPLGDVPECRHDAPHDAPWPTRHTPVHSVATDTSHQPRRQPTRHDDFSRGWSFARLVRERIHLVIVVSCCFILLLLVLVIVGVVLYSRHSAFYYTCEGDRSVRKKKLVDAAENKNNNSPASKGGPAACRPDVTIATIDELTDINGSQEVIKPGQVYLRE